MQLDSEKMAERCIMLAISAAVLMTIVFWGSWWIVAGSWVAVFPFALLLGLVSGFVAAAMGATVEEDDPQVWAQETETLIVESSTEIVGKFQDADIHEWVMLKRPDTGEHVRCMFERTIDMRRNDFEFEPPQNTWFCITPPGILYVAVHPENTAPQD